jgi:hypothetical protein
MNSPLDSRRLKWAVASTTFLLAGVMGCSSMQLDHSRYRPGRFEFDWPSRAVLTPAARRSADERLSVDAASLIVKLQDAAVTSAVSRANSHPPASPASVMKIDEEWSTAGIQDAAVSSRVDVGCSESLKLLNSDFEKVLVTDSRGHIVCQTHMTERYFQGDQPWWRECVASGRLSHTRLDYDAGSGAVALSIFAPVLDPSTGENIGVARASLRRRVGATK